MARRTIKTIATEAEAILRREAPRARERLLDADEIAEAIRRHLKQARKAGEEEVVHTKLSGGYVPNSYKYRAETDTVEITGRRVADLKVTARRWYAQSRAHGQDNTGFVRIRKPGQSQGRVADRW